MSQLPIGLGLVVHSRPLLGGISHLDVVCFYRVANETLVVSPLVNSRNSYGRPSHRSDWHPWLPALLLDLPVSIDLCLAIIAIHLRVLPLDAEILLGIEEIVELDWGGSLSDLGSIDLRNSISSRGQEILTTNPAGLEGCDELRTKIGVHL